MIRKLRNLSPKLLFFYGISLVFLVLNIWFCVKKDTYAASMIPFLFVIVLLAVYSVDRLLLLIVFLKIVGMDRKQWIPPPDPVEELLFRISFSVMMLSWMSA